jgi:multidrug efflux pump subunit AcrA (membrane-fusion protein)
MATAPDSPVTFAAAAYRDRFVTLENLEIPRVARSIAWLIALGLLLGGALLYFTPWVQTAGGYGKVVELSPQGRPQRITALVTGRIKKWYVRDADTVKEGDPLVELEDNDPQLVERLRAEVEALRAEASAARLAAETSRLDAERQERLFKKGLAARRDMESARVRYKEYLSKQAAAEAKIAPKEIGLTRLSRQIVRAPRDGMILDITAADKATLVKEGDVLATLAPTQIRRAVEISVTGLDAALIMAGRPARVVFEGWPAVQFSGWPAVAVGTFPGIVQSIDPVVSPDGRFGVVIVETPEEPWPSGQFLRPGGKARGWVLLGEVRLGYELWRRLNNFPPEPAPVKPGEGDTVKMGK